MKSITKVITLIGMPASGKTTGGELLAKKMGFEFMDLDSMVEKVEGMDLIQVMNNKGADYFRDMEYDFLKKIPSGQSVVISPAGSIIFQKDAMDWITNNSRVIFLDTPFNVIEKRLEMEPRAVAGLSERGLLSIWDERQPIYRKYADEVVSTDNKDIEAVTQDILNLIK